MNIQNIKHIQIAKNCTRTASVQVTDPTTTATYWGAGEVVVTKLDNTTVLDATTALGSLKGIAIHQRSFDGKDKSTFTIYKDAVKSYKSRLYQAAVEQSIVIDITGFDETNFTYVLTFRNKGQQTTYKSAYSVSVAVGDTAYDKSGLADAFVAALNRAFNDGGGDFTNFNGVATKDAGGNAIVIDFAQSYDVSLNRPLSFQRVTVQTNGFEATILDNLTGAIAYTTNSNNVTRAQANVGVGTYDQVHYAEITGRGFAERQFQFYAGAPYDVAIPYDTDYKYEADGTTPKRFDVITIGWEKSTSGISGSHSHKGNFDLYLPVEDNATSQVGVATTGIVAILNKWFVTELGVGTAVTVTT